MTTPKTLTLAMALNLGGCIAVIGGGHIDTESRSLPAFSRVENDSFVRVEVTLAEANDAELTCDANLLGRIRTDVIDGTLVVREQRGLGLLPTRKCVLTIATPNLVEAVNRGSGGLFVSGVAEDFEFAGAFGSGPLDLDVLRGAAIELASDGSGRLDVTAIVATEVHASHDGSGPVTLTGLDIDTAELDHDGSGHVELAGRARRFVLRTDGSGGVHAGDLDAEVVDVDADGSGSVTVSANDEVTGSLGGSGDLEVFGDPSIDVRETGSGRVIRR